MPGIKNIKSSVLLTVGTLAMAATSLSAPSLAQPGDNGGRPERAERGAPQRQQQQQAPRANQAQQARPERQAPVAPAAARGNDGPRGNAERPQQARPDRGRPPQGQQQQVRPQQVRPAGQQGNANEVRRNLPGWAGGTRNGEPVTRSNPPQGGNYRPNDRGNDRNNDRNNDRDRGPGRPGNDRGNDRGNGNWQNNGRGNGNERWRGNGNQNRNWDRSGWRRDNRYDWQGYRDRNRSTYRIGRYYAPYQNYSYRRLGLGFSLGSMFYGNRYWINDPWQYRLPAVYGPYRWVRYYDDVLLVDTYSGEVVDVIYDFFW
jgi:hypothetical protein